MTITEPGIHDGISDADYHADPVPEGSLSTSGAKRLLDCPARYMWEQTNRVDKSEYDYGHLAHRLVLGDGVMPWVVDAPDWRTKAAQDARKTARATGLAPVLRSDLLAATAMRREIRRHPIASRLFANGRPEVSMFARCPDTRLMMRARADWLTEHKSRPLIVDYKTVRTADPNRFGYAAWDYGYDIQDAWYRLTAHGAGLEDAAFVFVIQEKTAPYLVTVVELDDTARDIGAARGLAARRLYVQCRTTGHWPGYPTGIQSVTLPTYAHAPHVPEEIPA